MVQIFYRGRLFARIPWQGGPADLADCLAAAGAPADHPCGRHGKCGKCRVRAYGDLSEPSAAERALLSQRELLEGVRLSCEAQIVGPHARIELEEDGAPAIETSLLHRSAEWAPWARGLGLAVDIGTTTAAAYLWDLETRALLGVRACKNPQEIYGADVVSRLETSMGGGGQALQSALLRCLDQLARQLCREARRSVDELGGGVITGNTVMLYLLHGLPVEEIALAPFAARHLFGVFRPAAELGLHWGRSCTLYIPPCISAYVGADISCGLLACDMLAAREGLLLADIGTNGELAFFTGRRLLCCATAAGPAFEGVGISCGSGAMEGAVEAVSLEEGHLRPHVIGGGPARTLCGSGLLDAVYCLRQLGQLEESGFLEAEEVPLGERVRLTRRDIRALQLAKAAVCAGMETLLHTAQAVPGRVCLAGGFGCRLSLESAAGIGLLPAALAARAEPAGNTAAAGASLLLRSRAMTAEVERIAGLAETVELAANPLFQERFISDMALEVIP